MASPPFNPNEAIPGDTDVAANFPAAERTFRDVIESWMLYEHDRTGHHAFITDTTVNIAADTGWPEGALVFDTTLGVLQFCVDDDPSIVWDVISFPAGTRMLFQQTTAPPGWTKVTDAAYNNVALRLVTGTVSSGGTQDFTDVFAESTIEGETAEHILTTAEMPAHSHAYSGECNSEDNNNSGTTGNVKCPLRENHASGAGTFDTSEAGTLDEIEETGGGGGHTHDISVDFDLDVKYRDVILCEKD